MAGVRPAARRSRIYIADRPLYVLDCAAILIVEDENKFLSLSEEGEAIARAVMTRKKILMDFLVQILKVSPEQAEIDSCKTEHLISAETAKKLEEFNNSYQKASLKAS